MEWGEEDRRRVKKEMRKKRKEGEEGKRREKRVKNNRGGGQNGGRQELRRRNSQTNPVKYQPTSLTPTHPPTSPPSPLHTHTPTHTHSPVLYIWLLIQTHPSDLWTAASETACLPMYTSTMATVTYCISTISWYMQVHQQVSKTDKIYDSRENKIKWEEFHVLFTPPRRP